MPGTAAGPRRPGPGVSEPTRPGKTPVPSGPVASRHYALMGEADGTAASLVRLPVGLPAAVRAGRRLRAAARPAAGGARGLDLGGVDGAGGRAGGLRADAAARLRPRSDALEQRG